MPLNWSDFWKLFHKRWGSDHESPEYIKGEWSAMQRFLQNIEKRAPERRRE